MSSAPWDERNREVRLHRFGLGLGFALAALLHTMLLWGPQVRYRPALEEARLRRVMVAVPYQPVVPPPPPPAPRPLEPRPEPPPSAPPEPRPAPAPTAAPPAPSPGATEAPRTGVADRPRTESGVTAAAGPVASPDQGRSASAGPDAWSSVLAELESRRRNLSAEAARDAARAAAAQAAASNRGEGADAGFLDPRIRMKVVSYPPTAIEAAHPSIPYPDLRFHRAQLQAGICRVYYRIWTDGRGSVLREQIKTPDTEEALKRYQPFVEAVTRSVDDWPFDAMEAEIHVDVLFEIE